MYWSNSGGAVTQEQVEVFPVAALSSLITTPVGRPPMPPAPPRRRPVGARVPVPVRRRDPRALLVASVPNTRRAARRRGGAADASEAAGADDLRPTCAPRCARGAPLTRPCRLPAALAVARRALQDRARRRHATLLHRAILGI